MTARRHHFLDMESIRTELQREHPDQPWGAIPGRSHMVTLGMKAHLAGPDRPCDACRPYRGILFDPLDAPSLPIVGCERQGGCRCAYQ